MAASRSRRANAGNNMKQVMEKDEQDPFYATLYGGFFDDVNDTDFKANIEKKQKKSTEADNEEEGSSDSGCSDSEDDSIEDESRDDESNDQVTPDDANVTSSEKKEEANMPEANMPEKSYHVQTTDNISGDKDIRSDNLEVKNKNLEVEVENKNVDHSPGIGGKREREEPLSKSGKSENSTNTSSPTKRAKLKS